MRTFVAVEITNEEVRNSIEKFQNEVNIAAKSVEIHNIHFTLFFLGEIKEDVVESVKTALSSIEFKAFGIDFVGVGAFPKPKRPRVIWVGVNEESRNKLLELAKKVENVLSPLGFSTDKPFKPHVTVFRIKNKGKDVTDSLKKYSTTKFGTQLIREIKFKKSILTPNGPIYSDLKVVSAQ